MIEVAPTPRAALSLAGKAFQQYRAAAGVRTGVLPDLFHWRSCGRRGAAAATRDARRYRTYFPKITLIAPPYPEGTHGHVPGDLLRPPLVRLNGNAGDVHPTALEMVPASSARWIRMKAGQVVVRLRSGAGGRA
jgi:hypothetical protein